MFWCLVRLSTGTLSGGLYAIPLEMAIQSAVACSEAKDDGLLVSWQLMECVLVWVVSSSLAVEDGFLFVMDKRYRDKGTQISHQTSQQTSHPRAKPLTKEEDNKPRQLVCALHRASDIRSPHIMEHKFLHSIIKRRLKTKEEKQFDRGNRL